MIKLSVVGGNIMEYLEGKDLIINSANKFMNYGSGICGAIYKNAGIDLLLNYCKSNYNECMKVNEIRITPGFNLGIDILHILCPKYNESNEPIKDLIKSYENIFIKAKENNYKNIISVSLGTGVNGYKHNDVYKVVIENLLLFVKKYDIKFTLVLPSEEIKDVYFKHYRIILKDNDIPLSLNIGYIDENRKFIVYVDENNKIIDKNSKTITKSRAIGYLDDNEKLILFSDIIVYRDENREIFIKSIDNNSI